MFHGIEALRNGEFQLHSEMEKLSYFNCVRVCVCRVAYIQSVQDIRLVSIYIHICCLESSSYSACRLHAQFQLFYSEGFGFDIKYVITYADFKICIYA